MAQSKMNSPNWRATSSWWVVDRPCRTVRTDRTTPDAGPYGDRRFLLPNPALDISPSRAYNWGMPERKESDTALNVSCRNINIIVQFLKKREVMAETLLDHLGYPREYLSNPDNWIPLPVFIEIAKRTRKLFNDDPAIFYEIGLTTTAEGGLGAVEALKRTMGVIVANPTMLLRRMPKYNAFFNRTKDVRAIEVSADEALMEVVFRPGIDPVYDFNSGPFVKGVMASIPLIWNLPPAKVTERLLQYDPVRLLKQHCSLFAEMKDGNLVVEGKVYGKEVALVPHTTSLGQRYLGEHRELRALDPGARKAILITENLTYRSYHILEVGQLWNAPSFIIHLVWENFSYFSRLRRAFATSGKKRFIDLHELEDRAEELQRYAQELEASIAERNKIILEEKSEVDRLKNELSGILGSQLPPDLVQAMLSRKLIPKRNHGIVFFADLVGFSSRVHNAPDFAFMMHDLNRYFEISQQVIKGRGGWVYKYLGDGILAVFGGYKNNEDYAVLARGAIEAAKTIVTMVNEMGWDIRIGLEFGDFISGEIGAAGERIWDFLGETVNYACRLGQHANKNEVILGPKLRELLGDTVHYEERRMILKGMGEQIVFSLHLSSDSHEQKNKAPAEQVSPPHSSSL